MQSEKQQHARMEQLTSSFVALNVDGQQRLPFMPVRNVAAAEYIPSYTVQNTGPFSLAPMTFKATCQSVSANQPVASKQMEVEMEDEEMMVQASANLQTQIRRSERLAAKPRINYKEITISE